MKQGISKALVLSLGLLLLPFLAQTARADSFVDFACAASTCTGTVTGSSGNYSSTGIGGLQQTNTGGPDFMTGLFTLAFNTSTGAISLTGNAAANSDTLSGTITGFTPSVGGSSTLLALMANWTTLPADFSTYLNAGSGTGVGSVIYLNTGSNAVSVDFDINPTAAPEPASFLLLGMGLLALFGITRRKGVLSSV